MSKEKNYLATKSRLTDDLDYWLKQRRKCERRIIKILRALEDINSYLNGMVKENERHILANHSITLIGSEEAKQ